MVLEAPTNGLTTTDYSESIMAKSHYSADSASLPSLSLVFQVRSDATGSSRARVPDCGARNAGETFAITPSFTG